MEEEWRLITGFSNYEVSNLGQVRNHKFNRPVKSFYNGYYYEVLLYNKNKSYHNVIHRLVASAFLPNPDNLPVVDHIDRNPTNNIVTNLRWVSRRDNSLNNKFRKERERFGITMCREKYRVQFTVNGKLTSFGCYTTLEEAIQVRDYNLILNR